MTKHQDVTPFATDETTYAGNRPVRQNQNQLTLDGAIDEIATFDRVLKASEIDALYCLFLLMPASGVSPDE